MGARPRPPVGGDPAVIAVLSFAYMASITIRRLDEAVKAKLRARAASNRRSMEEEAREILRAGLQAKPGPRINLAKSIRSYVEPLGGVKLAIPPREPIRRLPEFTR